MHQENVKMLYVTKCYNQNVTSISSITNICNSIGGKKLNHKFTLLKESFYLCVFFNDGEKIHHV